MRRLYIHIFQFVFILVIGMGAVSVSCSAPPTRFDNTALTSSGPCVWVKPYYRSDGSCVRGHWRSAPGSNCSKVGTYYKPCGEGYRQATSPAN